MVFFKCPQSVFIVDRSKEDFKTLYTLTQYDHFGWPSTLIGFFFLEINSIYSYANIRPRPTPGGLNFPNLESTQLKNASTLVSAFLPK